MDNDGRASAVAKEDDHWLGTCIPGLKHEAGRLLPPQLRAKISESDLVQETLLRAAKHESLLDRLQPSQARKWLSTALERVAQSFIRHYRSIKRASRREVSLAATDSTGGRITANGGMSPEEVLIQEEQIEHLRRCLKRCVPRDQALVTRITLDGAPIKEVAAELRVSYTAAAKAHSRALENLRKLMQQGD